jgi:RNA polymerase sigma-70 factor (ECF subfamily)
MEQLVTAEIFETFRALTEAQRDVLALRIVAGLSLEQTAQVLGKRTGAVKALQHRALETLKRVLDEENVTL